MDSLVTIAGIYYPKRKLLHKDVRSIRYAFLLEENFSFTLSIEGVSPHLFLERNHKEELLLRKDFNTLSLQKSTSTNRYSFFRKKPYSTLTIHHKIVQAFSLSNGNYLLSAYNHLQEHYLVLVDPTLTIIKEQQVGRVSWHSQNAIDEKEDTIMYAEYGASEESTEVSIYRSTDMGMSWHKSFSLQAPEELRHWHTLQADPYRPNCWLATSGDTPTQSRWFLSEDKGIHWSEITDTLYQNTLYPSRSLSAHRTTSIHIDPTHYYWSTDDLMGSVPNYFVVQKGVRKSSSKLYRSKKSNPLQLELLANLGIHGRSFIETTTGYLVFTEAKYVTYNVQLFYIDKKTFKAYFLLNLEGDVRTGGTYSIHSPMDQNNCCYLKFTNRSNFLGKNYQTLKVELNHTPKEQERLQTHPYDIRDYIVFEEHLWFLNTVESVEDILFSHNKVSLKLKNQNTLFYMLLGDAHFKRLAPKALFDVRGYHSITISCNKTQLKETAINLFIQSFDETSKLGSHSYKLEEEENHFTHILQPHTSFIKLLFRFSHLTEDEVTLSNLHISLHTEQQ
jgi:hypothetical protein